MKSSLPFPTNTSLFLLSSSSPTLRPQQIHSSTANYPHQTPGASKSTPLLQTIHIKPQQIDSSTANYPHQTSGPSKSISLLQTIHIKPRPQQIHSSTVNYPHQILDPSKSIHLLQTILTYLFLSLQIQYQFRCTSIPNLYQQR